MPLSTSDKQKVTQLEETIKKKLKDARSCFIAAESLVILITLVTIIEGIFKILDTLDEFDTWTIVFFGAIYAFTPVFSLLQINKLIAESIDFRADKSAYITYIVIACPPIRWIIGTIFAGAGICAYMTGWYFGLACIPNIVGYVFIISSFKTSLEKWNIQYADDIQRYKEEKETQKQLQLHQKEINTVSSLLTKVGNKFFVKYYNQLKDWSEPDILDIIEEDYTEETKRQRIRKAKEIFNSKLHILALKQISDDANIAVDKQTKERAKEILEQLQN